jgi:hypothetical protein
LCASKRLPVDNANIDCQFKIVKQIFFRQFTMTPTLKTAIVMPDPVPFLFNNVLLSLTIFDKSLDTHDAAPYIES